MNDKQIADLAYPILRQLEAAMIHLDVADAAKLAGKVSADAEDLANAKVEERDHLERWKDHPSLSPMERNPTLARGIA